MYNKAYLTTVLWGKVFFEKIVTENKMKILNMDVEKIE